MFLDLVGVLHQRKFSIVNLQLLYAPNYIYWAILVLSNLKNAFYKYCMENIDALNPIVIRYHNRSHLNQRCMLACRCFLIL
jgi:hypothetical protein